MTGLRHLLFLSLVVCPAVLVRAQTPPLLADALQKWNAEKGDWAFTQRVKTFFDDGRVKEERLERFDPSLADEHRWHLLEMNGGEPTAAQRERWETRKNAKARRHADRPFVEYFDSEHARQVADDAHATTYEVAIKPEASRFVPVDKVNIELTVGKESRAIERITANLREPMRVALGLARILDVDLDVHFDQPTDDNVAVGDSGPQASGTARVEVTKLGSRAEYAWSDFKRVTRQ